MAANQVVLLDLDNSLSQVGTYNLYQSLVNRCQSK